MDLKKPSTSSNKIAEIVRLQQMIKKWKKLAVTPKNNNPKKKSINFLKRTLSFSDNANIALSGDVPKGFLAVSVGEEMKRYVIPTDYLSHMAFVDLLREAEEEFGFQQEGILRMPCDTLEFEGILKVVEKNKEGLRYCSSEADLARAHRPQNPMCR